MLGSVPEESLIGSVFSGSVLQQPLGRLEARLNKRLPRNEMRKDAELHTLLCKAADSNCSPCFESDAFKGSAELTLLTFTVS